MEFTIEVEQEVDGSWIAEILDIPGLMAYGSDREEALANANALAIEVQRDNDAPASQVRP